MICLKYKDSFPDLQSQVCQTYMNEIGPSCITSVSYPTLYGSIVGLAALGHSVISSLLLPSLENIENKLLVVDSNQAIEDLEESEVIISPQLNELERRRCLDAVTIALGRYMIMKLRLPHIPRRTYVYDLILYLLCCI
jgi:hypothetical protein